VPPEQKACPKAAQGKKGRKEVAVGDPAQHAEAQAAAIGEIIPDELNISPKFGEYQHEKRSYAPCVGNSDGGAFEHDTQPSKVEHGRKKLPISK
jgi:hypothetical protein